MKLKFSLTFVLCLFTAHSLFADIEGLSVVVIGGGPCGLATAIQARLNGAEVSVVEKRDSYTRLNTLFLYDSTLMTLEKLGVHCPLMQELYFKESRRGFVIIKELEKSLSERAAQLGIPVFHGEFKDFGLGEGSISVAIENQDIILHYDLLIAADGAHSLVREKLGIDCQIQSEKANAGFAVLPAVNPEKLIGVRVTKTNDFFLKKVTIPQANILFLQTRPGIAMSPVNSKEFEDSTQEAEWLAECKLIREGQALVVANIPVTLQKATAFYDKNRKTILLGDAAGCGSFYQGMTANTAFKAVEFADLFFSQFPQDLAYDYL